MVEFGDTDLLEGEQIPTIVVVERVSACSNPWMW
jgi:hypothetical protein